METDPGKITTDILQPNSKQRKSTRQFINYKFISRSSWTILIQEPSPNYPREAIR